MILQDSAVGATADLTDRAVAWWNGERVVYAYVRDDDGQIDSEFNLEPHWNEWREWLDEWMIDPVFSVRPELQNEILPAPPSGAVPDA
jgi:hypothetical protein